MATDLNICLKEPELLEPGDLIALVPTGRIFDYQIYEPAGTDPDNKIWAKVLDGKNYFAGYWRIRVQIPDRIHLLARVIHIRWDKPCMVFKPTLEESHV